MAAPPTPDRPRVLITRRVFPDLQARLAEHFEVRDNPEDAVWSGAELREQLAGCVGLMCTAGERVDAALLDAHPQLRVVSNIAVGLNNIDLQACAARDVTVTHTPDVLNETTADLGFALLLAAARRLSEAERYLRRGDWSKWAIDQFAGADVYGSTLGILGMGRIGQAIARRGALGFGMKVVYHNRSPLPAETDQALGARWVAKDGLLAEADHLVLVLPYSPASHHIIGAAELAAMKRGATLVNIARGGIVDDAALARALEAGTIGAAGLDVFENEPALHPALLAAPNLVLTPHIGSGSLATRRAMVGLAVDNLIAALGCGPDAGRPPAPAPRPAPA